jgi:hypothetical protein
MKRKSIIAPIMLSIFLSLIMINTAFAGDCSNAMVSAMQEEGLTQEQINRICLKAAMKEEGLSDEQIRRIVSKTGTMPAVTPKTAPEHPPETAPVPKVPATPAVTRNVVTTPKKVPDPVFTSEKIESDIIGKCIGGLRGWCFEKGEYREIEVIETDVDRRQAKIVIHVETIKNHSGKLIAEYRMKNGEWELDDLESITFK